MQLIERQINEGKSISASIQIADGYAHYLFDKDAFYIGGYAQFAGDECYEHHPRVGVKTDKKLGWQSYDIKFTLAEANQYMTYSIAALLLGKMS